MDYLTWIKILAIAVRLVQEPAFDKEFRVHTGWTSIDRINLYGSIQTSLLSIDIYRAGSDEKLRSFVFVPWEDFSEGGADEGDLTVSLLDGLYTVTPYALVYEIYHQYYLTPAEEEVMGIFLSVFNRLIGYEYCNEVIEKEGGFTMPGQLQVIELKEYRYYAEIYAAIPGSQLPDPQKITMALPAKMIRLVMAPDMGASRKQWIRGTEPYFKPYFDNIKGELAKVLPDTVKKYETLFSAEPQTGDQSGINGATVPESLYTEPVKTDTVGDVPRTGKGTEQSGAVSLQTDPEIERPADEQLQTKQPDKVPGANDLLKKQDVVESVVKDTLNKNGDKAVVNDQHKDREDTTFIPQDPGGYSMEDLFPDYRPKLTPDYVLNYMPSLAGAYENLPEVTTANLPEYLILFKHYRKQARKRPGEWVEGNILLGGLPEEYNPSPAELMLSETGERIRLLTEQYKEQCMKILDERRIKTRKITYQKYSFIHYDVMGSGRFFFAVDNGEVTVKLYEKYQ
jgi:hypothetical protein